MNKKEFERLLKEKQNKHLTMYGLECANPETSLNLTELIKTKREDDKLTFYSFWDWVNDLSLTMLESDNHFLSTVKDYYNFLMYRIALEFIFKDLKVKGINLSGKNLYVNFTNNEEAKSIIKKWTKRLNEGVKMDGFGYLSKTPLYNQAGFFMKLIYILANLTKKDSIKAFWKWNLECMLEVIFIKEDEHVLNTDEGRNELRNKLKDWYASFDFKDDKKGSKKQYESILKQINNLHPGKCLEPWLRKKVVDFKNKHPKSNFTKDEWEGDYE